MHKPPRGKSGKIAALPKSTTRALGVEAPPPVVFGPFTKSTWGHEPLHPCAAGFSTLRPGTKRALPEPLSFWARRILEMGQSGLRVKFWTPDCGKGLMEHLVPPWFGATRGIYERYHPPCGDLIVFPRLETTLQTLGGFRFGANNGEIRPLDHKGSGKNTMGLEINLALGLGLETGSMRSRSFPAPRLWVVSLEPGVWLCPKAGGKRVPGLKLPGPIGQTQGELNPFNAKPKKKTRIWPKIPGMF